jgi:hypothetical protein
MKPYKPRRAGKRWLEGAPAYVLDVFDNKGETADRYTVLFTDEHLTQHGDKQFATTYVPYLGMSGAPSHPQGISQWGETCAYDAVAYRYRCGKQRIKWLDLPENIRRHVVRRAET